jgi:hypothetical protein
MGCHDQAEPLAGLTKQMGNTKHTHDMHLDSRPPDRSKQAGTELVLLLR